LPQYGSRRKLISPSGLYDEYGEVVVDDDGSYYYSPQESDGEVRSKTRLKAVMGMNTSAPPPAIHLPWNKARVGPMEVGKEAVAARRRTARRWEGEKESRGSMTEQSDSETGSGSRESPSEFSPSDRSSPTSSATAETETNESDLETESDDESRDEEESDSYEESGTESEGEEEESGSERSKGQRYASKSSKHRNVSTDSKRDSSSTAPRPKTLRNSRSSKRSGRESEENSVMDASDDLSPIMEDTEEDEKSSSQSGGGRHKEEDEESSTAGSKLQQQPGGRKRRIKLMVDREYETSSTGEESVPETQRSRLSATHNSHVNVNGGIYVAQNGSIVRTRRSSASSAKNNLKPSSPIFSSRLAKHFKKLDKMAATLEERVPLNTTKTQAGEGRHTLSTFQSCRRAASATAASSFSSSHKMLNVLNTRQSSVSLGEPLECPSDRTQSDEEELWMGPWNSLHIPMTKL
uniref:Uncharacterized protein n=1 Tax=Poecilia formosa TaxID=48698 RepID=A0A096MC02_POEFO